MQLTGAVEDIALKPAQGEGDIQLYWQPAGPELVLSVDFEMTGQELVGSFGIDWSTIRLTLRCRPQVTGERLRWDFRLNVQLHPEVNVGPAGIAQYQVHSGIHAALQPLIDRWGTLVKNGLLLLPLRPMEDAGKFFESLAKADSNNLFNWVTDQFYHPDVPVSWRKAWINSCLLPNNLLRVVAAAAGYGLDVPSILFTLVSLISMCIMSAIPPVG